VLRVTRPGMHRPFKAPGGWTIPVLGIFACLALLSFLPPVTLMRFALWIALGLVVYFGYAARRNRDAAAKA
jgi:APA family basic amino acid/polyamine antiporter